MGDARTPSITADVFRMENDPGKSITNDTTEGVDTLGASSTGIGCLTVVDVP